MMAMPVAGEEGRGIVRFFEAEEFAKARVAGFDLGARGPAVIGEIVAAALPDREVDEAAEGGLRGAEASGSVRDAKIENDAGLWLARPGEDALLIALDQANRAVDDRHAAAAQ